MDFDFYLDFVRELPLVAAALQFAVLGTLGEILARLLRTKRLALPFSPGVLLLKMLAWAILGIVIKYGFVLMKGGVVGLIMHNMLPEFCAEGIAYAFAVSFFTNAVFGPGMMFFHRLEDNLIERKHGFAGIEKSLLTLAWFWIPAHTLTFSLPADYQIGLAALWSVVLGLILGLGGMPKQTR